MSDEEIMLHYKAFNFETSNSILLKNLTKKVYQSWFDTKSEIDYYKLTFLFDDKDIIEDDLPLIGYLDDIIVLQYKGS